MKKVILAAAVILFTMAMNTAAVGGPFSVRLGVGALAWYCWWQPPWTRGYRLTVPQAECPVSIPYRIKSYETRPAPQYGFTLTGEFLKSWYFSTSLLFGNFQSWSKSTGATLPGALTRLSYTRDIKKYDFEAFLGYRVNRYFSAFLCLRTRAYDYTERIHNAALKGTDAVIYKASGRGEHIDVGPGLGFSVTVPMPGYEAVFLYFQGYGLIMATSSSFVNDYQYQFINGILMLPVGQYDKESFYSWSGQGSLSLGYTLSPAGVTFMLGGRYEVIFYRHHRLMKGFLRYNRQYDHFYGMTFMIAYAVTITSGDQPN